MINEKFTARLNELNACQTTEEVANLLRRDGIKGEKDPLKSTCSSCVIAKDLRRFMPRCEVGCDTIYPMGSSNYGEVISSVNLITFIREWDEGKYPDLVETNL